MGRTKSIGKVESVQKIWLSKKELASYLGVPERYVESNLNTNPEIEIYRISPRCCLYSKDNIDRTIKRSRQ